MKAAEKFVCVGCPNAADHCYPETRSKCSRKPLIGIEKRWVEEARPIEYKLEHFDSGEFAGWNDYKFLWAMGVSLRPDSRKS